MNPWEKPQGRHELGAGLTVEEWLKRPDKVVTRRELWVFITAYDRGLQRVARNRRWYRRLWRWLKEPLRPLQGDRKQEDTSTSP